jgi:tetratricopeptide (TPR) repeat protein
MGVVIGRLEEGVTDAAERARLEKARDKMNYLLADRLMDLADETDTDDPQRQAALDEVAKRLELLQRKGEVKQVAKITGRMAYAKAVAVEQKEGFSAAAEHYNKAAELLEQAHQGFNRSDYKVAALLVQIYQKQKISGKAKAIVDDIAAAGGNVENVSLMLVQAKQAISFRRYGEARQLIAQVLRRDPENTEARTLQAVLASESGRIPEEMELTPRHIYILVERAEDLWKNGERDAALTMLENLSLRAPDNMIVTQTLLRHYVDLDEREKAEQLLARARRAMPDSRELEVLAALLQERDPDQRYALQLKMIDEQKGVAGADPKLVEMSRAVIKHVVALRNGKSDDALKFLQQATELYPDHPSVISHWFDHAIRIKDWELAREYARKAADINIDGVDGLMTRGQLAFAQEKFSEAIPLLKQVTEKRPDIKPAWVMLARSYLQTDDTLDRAYETYKTLAENDPRYAPAAVAMLRMSILRGDLEGQVTWLERANALAPDDPFVKERMLDRMARTGEDIDTIITRREATVRENPDDLTNRLQLGRLYERKNEVAKAEAQLRYVYRNHSNRLEATQILSDFLVKTGRGADAQRMLEEFTRTAEDKVGALLLYGGFMLNYDAQTAKETFEKALSLDSGDPRVYIQLTRYYARAQDFANAASMLEKYLQIQPGNLNVQKDLVRYLIQAGNMKAAGDRLERMAAASPNDPQVLSLMGARAMAMGDAGEARRRLDAAIELEPDYAQAYALRAQLHMQNQDLAKAEADLAQAALLSSEPNYGVDVARLQMVSGQTDRAENTLRGVLQNSPSYEPAIRMLLGLYLRNQRWSQMEQQLTQVYQQYPRVPEYRLLEAEMWRQRRNGDRHLQAVGQALEMSPGSIALLQRYLDTLLAYGRYEGVLSTVEPYKEAAGFMPLGNIYIARALWGQNKTDEAEALFREVCKKTPVSQLSFVRNHIATALGEQAPAKLKQWLVEARPDEVEPKLSLAELFLSTEFRDLDSATELLRQAASQATSPAQRVRVHRLSGAVHYEQGNIAEAEKSYLAAIKIDPNDVRSLNNLAYLYVEDVDQPAKGVEYAKQAATLAPMDANVLDTYGWALAKAGQHRQAERQFLAALHIQPDLAALRYHLGWVYQQDNRTQDAQREYQRALEVVDEQDPLRAKIEKQLNELTQARS